MTNAALRSGCATRWRFSTAEGRTHPQSQTAPRLAEGASATKDYALYLLDPTATTVARIVGSVTPRELGRPKDTATQTGTDAAGVATWSIRYAGGVCYRANGSYTTAKPTNAYLYAYDRQLSVEATDGGRGRCIFTEFPVYPTPVTPWADGAAPARLCPPDRPDCASESGTLGYRIAGPVDPRAATDATLPLPPVTLFTTTLTDADGRVVSDTLRFLKANGTSGEVRYGGLPLDGATSRVIAGPDGRLYLIVRSYGDPANRSFLARLDPADPRTVTPLTTPPSR